MWWHLKALCTLATFAFAGGGAGIFLFFFWQWTANPVYYYSSLKTQWLLPLFYCDSSSPPFLLFWGFANLTGDRKKIGFFPYSCRRLWRKKEFIENLLAETLLLLPQVVCALTKLVWRWEQTCFRCKVFRHILIEIKRIFLWREGKNESWAGSFCTVP